MNINLHIIVQTPPAGLHYGLQKGSGGKFEIEQIQETGKGDLSFNFAVEIKGNSTANPVPDFKGPYVQGKAGERFIYINIGVYAGFQEMPSGRMKIPLSRITWDIVEKAQAKGLETKVPGAGKNDAPAFATVKPFAGWHQKI